ncbi:hypothetical protein, partial [Allopusillimonas soli]
GLAQDPDDLLIVVSRLLHVPLAIEEAIVSSYLGSKKPGQVNLNICLSRICDFGLQGFPPSLDLLVDLLSSRCVFLLEPLCFG